MEPLPIETSADDALPERLPPDEFREWCRNRICPDASVSTARDKSNLRLAIFLTGCKRWQCDVCGPQKRAKLIARILDARPTRFLTLTVQAPTEDNGLDWTPREAFDKTRRSCSELFKAMNRSRRKTEYCRILEQTKRGYPHYHYLTKGPFWPIDEIRTHWQRLTGAFVVDIRRPTETRQTTTYVAKYLTKGNHVEFTNRRFAASRKFWRPCPRCEKAPCKCEKPEQWIRWQRFDHRAHWFGPVEEYSNYHSFTRSNYPGVYWLDDRQPGAELPIELQHPILPLTTLG